ncbi:sensor histidine kinase [Sphingomonas hankookensis]|uniref:sensor histidine kinase n=1 Tax=Sphingomonas hankookensis TaxID=563996 RepID=UPI003F7AC2DE
MPDPPAVRLTLADAAAALRGADNGLSRSIGPPPAGAPNPVQQQVLARALGRPVGDVRVAWLDPAARRSAPRGEVIVLTAAHGGGKALPGGAMLLRMKGGRPMRVVDRLPDGPLGAVLLRLPQPAFAAGVRLSDGRWLTVRPASSLLGGWRWKVLVALAVSLVVLAPLVWIFARRLTRPFRVLARAIDAGLDPPEAQGPRELQEAAGAIVQLRTRLAAESEERLRMLTAVAHDLRTPLTSLKLRLESVAEPQRARMVDDANRMQAMIADVLDFARTADAERRAVAVRDLIAQVVADAPAMTLDDGPEVTVCVGAGLRRAVENLVRNAIDYAGGGRIAVARRGSRR